MFNEDELMNKQEKRNLTFSRCNTNNLFWCIASKGTFIAYTPIKIVVTMLILKTPLKSDRRPNRWANGSKRGRLMAPKLPTIVAIMFSAGESAPTRPVCHHKTSATSFTQGNLKMTNKRHEYFNHTHNQHRSSQQRHGLTDGISPQGDIFHIPHKQCINDQSHKECECA